MVRPIEEKTVQLGKVTPTLNNALLDYAKLIGITKIELLEELIAKELEGRVLTKGFIVPDKPFYFNLDVLLTEGTVMAERRRIDAFELWCWRRLLRVPWTSHQSILKEINPEYSLEGLMLKMKLQYFGHLMPRTDSFEKILMLGKIEEGRRGDNKG